MVKITYLVMFVNDFNNIEIISHDSIKTDLKLNLEATNKLKQT
jgi:hypothetical protein